MKKIQLPNEQITTIIDLALDEDIGQGDATSEALIPPELIGEAYIESKAGGIIAGGSVAAEVFFRVDPLLQINFQIEDGSQTKPGDIVATISGNVRSILKAERTALNFLRKLSGIASETALYISETKDCSAKIVDTRKTTPGFRILEKYAVRMGGGQNHRFHMADAVLIKDTHLTVLKSQCMNLSDIISKAKKNTPEGLTIEVEVDTPEEAMEAAKAGANMILLDNMRPEEMQGVINSLPEGVRTEASGGITLENVRKIALSGVDIISIGSLTHSSKALDISLEIYPESLQTK